jgi:hypothetical protein
VKELVKKIIDKVSFPIQEQAKNFWKEHNHRMVYIAIFLIFTSLVINFSASAESGTVNLYAKECAGYWQHPENITGAPDLKKDETNFSVENSALPIDNPSHIDCGNFQGGIPGGVTPKKFIVHLSWLVSATPVVNYSQSNSLNIPFATSSNNEIIPEVKEEKKVETNQNDLIVSSSTSESTIVSTSTDGNLIQDDVVEAAPVEPLVDTNISQTPSVSTEDSNLSIIISPQLDPASSTIISGQEISDESTSIDTIISATNTEVVPLPFSGGTTISGQELSNSGTTVDTLINESKPVENNKAIDPLTVLTPDGLPTVDFVGLEYSIDGVEWKDMGAVNGTNWKDAAFELRNVDIKTWDDVSNIKIRISTLLTNDYMPKVYIDSVYLEASYEDIPTIIDPPKVYINDSSVVMDGKNSFTFDENPTFVISDPGLTTSDIQELVDEKSAEIISDPRGLIDIPENIPATESASDIFDVKKNILDPFIDNIFQGAEGVKNTVTSFVLPTVALAADGSSKITNAVVFGVDGNKADIPVVISSVVVDGITKQQISISKPKRAFVPGKYSLKISLETAQAIIISQHDFSWGVLALNTDKSIYQEGDLAFLQMGAINDLGHTICNASMTLVISDPDGGVYNFSSDDHSIETSGQCTGDSYVTVPDYSAYFKIPNIVGVYNMILTASTTNGVRAISSNFLVKNDPDFDVTRTGPTRVFPAASYPVSAKITPKSDWTGIITEKVPSSFTISPASFSETPYSSVVTTGETTTISWNVSLTAGVTKTIGYYFNAPTKSPDFFLLGPLSFFDSGIDINTGTSTFSEYRQWQIANDALCTATASGTWSGGASVWTDCGHTPTTNDTVVINSGVTVTLDQDTAALGTVTVNGTLDASALSCGSGARSCSSTSTTLSIGSSGTYIAGTNSTINLTGTTVTWLTLASGGTFTAGSSTVLITGGTGTVNSGAFTGSNKLYDLTFSSGSTVKTLGANLVVGNITRVGTGAGSTQGGVLDLSTFTLTTGYMYIDTSTQAELKLQASTLYLTGTSTSGSNEGMTSLFTRPGALSSNGVFTPGTGIVEVNADASVTVFSGATTFGNIKFTPVLSTDRTYTITGTTTITSATLTSNPSNTGSAHTLSLAGTGMTFGTTATFLIQGGSSNPTSITGNVSVGNFSIDSTGIFNANGQTLSLTGTGGNLLSMTSGGAFNAGTSTVTIITGSTITLNGGTGSFTGSNALYNLTMNPTANPTKTLGANLTVTNITSILLGVLDTSASNYTFSSGYISVPTNANSGLNFRASNIILTATDTSGAVAGLTALFTRGTIATVSNNYNNANFTINSDGSVTLFSVSGTPSSILNDITFSPVLSGSRTQTFGTQPTVNGNILVNPSGGGSLTVSPSANLTLAANKNITIEGCSAGAGCGATATFDTRSASTDWSLTTSGTSTMDIESGGLFRANGSSVTLVNLSVGVSSNGGTYNAMTSTTTTISKSITVSSASGCGGGACSGGTLQAKTSTITLNGNSLTGNTTPFAVNTGGTFDISTGTSTFVYKGTNAVTPATANIANLTYSYLTLDDASTSLGTAVTYSLSGASTTVQKLLRIGGASGKYTILDTTVSNYDLTAEAINCSAAPIYACSFIGRSSLITITGTDSSGYSTLWLVGPNGTGSGSSATTTTLKFTGNGTITFGTKVFLCCGSANTIGNLLLAPTLTTGVGNVTYTMPGSGNGLSIAGNFTVNPSESDGGNKTLTVLVGQAMTIPVNKSIIVQATNTGGSTATGILDTVSGTSWGLTTGHVDIESGGKLNLYGSAVTVTGTSSTLFINNSSSNNALNAGTSTVTFTGAAPNTSLLNSGTFTTSTNNNFYNLTINNASFAAPLGTVTEFSSSTVVTTGTLDTSTSNCSSTSCNLSGPSLSLAGAGATFLARSATVTLSGNSSSPRPFDNTSGSTFTAASSTVVITATSGTVTFNRSSVTFYNLTINSTATKIQPTGTIGIAAGGRFYIQQGTYDDLTSPVSGTGSSLWQMDSGTRYRVGGVFPSAFTNANMSFNSNSTVEYYYAGGAYNISATPTYGNLEVVTNTGATGAAATTTVTGNLIMSGSGGYLQSNGTFNISGTATVNSSASIWYTNGSAPCPAGGCDIITGGLTVTAGTVRMWTNNALTVSGNVLINGGTLNMWSTPTVSVGGNWTYSSGTINIANSSVTFTTTSTASINGPLLTPFYNIAQNGVGGVVSLATTTTITNNFTITAGTFDDAGKQITGNVTGTLSMATNTTLKIGAASATTFPTSFTNAHISLSPLSNVIYNSTSAQNISATPTYGSLQLSLYTGATPTIKSLQATTTLTGLLVIDANNTFDVTASNYSLIMSSARTSGVLMTNNGTFNSRAGTVTFNGASTSGATSTSGTWTGSSKFYNLTINNASFAAPLGSNIELNTIGTLLITLGTLNTSSNNYTITSGYINIANSASAGITANASDIIVNATSSTLFTLGSSSAWVPGTSTFYVQSYSGAPILLATTTSFYNLTASTSAAVINQGANMTVTNQFYIRTGGFNNENRTTTGTGATFQMDFNTFYCIRGTTGATNNTCDSGVTQTVATGLPTFTTYSFNASSTVVYLNNADITVSSTPTYGNLKLQPVLTAPHNYTLGIMNINGDFDINPNSAGVNLLTVKAGGTINVASTKTTYIQRQGSNATSKLVMRPVGTDYNLNTGNLTVTANNTLDCTNAVLTIITVAGNWLNNGSYVITGGTPTVRFTTTGSNTITNTVSSPFYDLIQDGIGGTMTLASVVTINNNLVLTNGTFEDGGNQITGNATGVLTMATGTILKLGTTGVSTTFPALYTNANITLDPGSTVTYNSTVNQNISGTPTYGNLRLSAASGTPNKSPAANLSIIGSLTVDANNTFDVTAGGCGGVSCAIILAGDFTNNGTFTAQTGNITLVGSSTQTFTGRFTATSTSQLYDLTVNNNSGVNPVGAEVTGMTASLYFASPITITNNFTIGTIGTPATHVRVKYNNGSSYIFNNVSWVGTVGAAQNIYFRNSVAGSGHWYLSVTGTQTINYVDVSRSDASGSPAYINALGGTNTDSGFNINWVFYFISISGNAYDDITTGTVWSQCGVVGNISVVVNGILATTTTCNPGTGAYTVTSVGASPGQSISVFYNATHKGTDVTIVPTTPANITGMDIHKGFVWIQDGVGTIMTNAKLADCDSTVTNCSNIPYTVSSGNLALNAGYGVYVDTTGIFAPAGDVSADTMNIVGSYNGNTETITLSGTSSSLNLFDVAGAFNQANTNVVITSASGNPTLLSGNTTFHILTINAAATVINAGAQVQIEDSAGAALHIQSGVLNDSGFGIATAGSALNTLQIDPSATLCLGGSSGINTSATCDSTGITSTNPGSTPAFANYTLAQTSNIFVLYDSPTTIYSPAALTFGNLVFRPILTSSQNYTINGTPNISGDFDLNPNDTGSGFNLDVIPLGNITVDSGKSTKIRRQGSTATSKITLNPSGTSFDLSTGFINVAVGGTLDGSGATSNIYLTATSGTLFTRVGTFNEGNTAVNVTSSSGSPTFLSAATTFYAVNIAANSANVINAGADITTNNNPGNIFRVVSGVFNQENTTMTGGTGSTLQVDPHATLCLGGTTGATNSTCDSGTTQTVAQTMPVFASYNFSTTSNEIYLSDANTTVSSTPTYGILSIKPKQTSPRTYTLGGTTLNIAGGFDINPGTAANLLTVNAGADIIVSGATATTTIERTGSATSKLVLNPVSTSYNLTTGYLDVGNGAMLEGTSATSTITLTGISGTLFTNAGTFNPGNTTVLVTGVGSPILSSPSMTFYNVAINSAPGTVYLAATTTIDSAATLDVLNGTLDTSTTTLSVGHINIASSSNAILKLSTSTVLVTGNTGVLFTRGASGALDSGTSVVNLTGNGSATVNSGTFIGPNKFYDFTSSGTGTKTLGGAIETANTFNVTGGTFDTSGSNYNITTNSLSISASKILKANGSTITNNINWTNNGTFTADTSTVVFTSSATSTIDGSTSFYNLTLTNATAKEVDFTASGGTPIFDVTHTFTVTGHVANLIRLRSTSSPTKWQFHPTGTAVLSYLDVQDGGCQVGAITMYPSLSTNSGNNDSCWNFSQFMTYTTTANSLTFGALSSVATRYATNGGTGTSTETEAHQINVTSNSASGYSLFVQGSSLSYAGNTITPITVASGGPLPPSVGTSQFGMRAVLLSGTGLVSSPYDTVDFDYDGTSTSTSMIATESGGGIMNSIYSLRYMCNVPSTVVSGRFTSDLTYIVVPNF